MEGLLRAFDESRLTPADRASLEETIRRLTEEAAIAKRKAEQLKAVVDKYKEIHPDDKDSLDSTEDIARKAWFAYNPPKEMKKRRESRCVSDAVP